MPDFTKIAIIDLSNPHDSVVSKFADAYSTAGFAYIKNHSVSQLLIDETFKASKNFHRLNEAEKRTILLDKNHRGYIPINTSTDVNSKLADVKKPNQSSSFMMMRESDEKPHEYLSGPNRA